MMSQEEWSSNSLSSPTSTGSMDQEFFVDSLTNLVIESQISKTKYPIFTVVSLETGNRYAMKFFPALNEKVSPFFENEIRFEQSASRNVISAIKYGYDEEIRVDGQMVRGSYIIMEYAPFGNFFQITKKYGSRFDDRLIRTYFHQLINGIEYLHSMGAAHLDLKPENLLLGQDLQLKIADFDTSYVQGDQKILAKGTRFKRAPELLGPKEKIVPWAADVFAAGIILFTLKTGGKIPQAEELIHDGENLLQLMWKDPKKFWKTHLRMLKQEDDYFENSFRTLFIGMTKEKPKDRLNLEQIKNSAWFNGPTYSDQEMEWKMREIMNMSPDEEVSSPTLTKTNSNFFKDPYDMDSLQAEEGQVEYF
jgi:serine/threonine protein kinase